MHFAVAGNSRFAERIASGLLDAGHVCDLAISLTRERRPTGSEGLSVWASLHGIEYGELEDINSGELHDIMSEERFSPQFLLASWPQILTSESRAHFPLGVIGSHPTTLPWGRGRHPLHWAICMGLDRMDLSFFIMDDGVDTGPLLVQSPFLIPQDVSIDQLLYTVEELGYELAMNLGTTLMKTGELPKAIAPSGAGSSWRARDENDVTIDCRMSLDAISRLVRSFAEPFPGARLATPSGDLRVQNVENVTSAYEDWRFFSVGTVLSARETSVHIRVDDGVGDFRVQLESPSPLTAGQQLRTPASVEQERTARRGGSPN